MTGALFSDDYFQDPYAMTAKLRADAAVHRAQLPNGLRTWIIGRYGAARAALADERLAKDAAVIGAIVTEQLAAAGHRPVPNLMLSGGMLFVEGPAHARVKRLVGRVLSKRRAEAMRERVAAVSATLLDEFDREPGPVDLVSRYAVPVPLLVMAELMGIPDADLDALRDWTTVLMIEDPDDTPVAGAAMRDYVADLVAAKRRAPGDDLLSELIRAEDDGDTLTADEVLYNVITLIVAGHETTTNAIGNSVVELLREPARWQALTQRPELIPAAVEELIRVVTPVRHATYRYTAEPVTIDGTTIPARELVLVSLVSAARDPEAFTDPDAYDPHRPAAQARAHLGFGHGAHYCVGAALARVELTTVLRQLTDRYPDARLAVPAETLVWGRSPVMLGYESVPVLLRP